MKNLDNICQMCDGEGIIIRNGIGQECRFCDGVGVTQIDTLDDAKEYLKKTIVSPLPRQTERSIKKEKFVFKVKHLLFMVLGFVMISLMVLGVSLSSTPDEYHISEYSDHVIEENTPKDPPAPAEYDFSDSKEKKCEVAAKYQNEYWVKNCR